MEEKIREMRKKIEKILQEENITFYEWSRIESYINTKYETIKEKSILK